jgi:hypothetical protein
MRIYHLIMLHDVSLFFRVVNRYVGNLPPMPGVFSDYPAPVVRNIDKGTALVTMRWGLPRHLGSVVRR